MTWTAENWRGEVSRQLARRAKLYSDGKSAAVALIFAITGVVFALVNVPTDSYGEAQGSIGWMTTGIVVALVFGSVALRTWMSVLRTRRETAAAQRWCDDAGPKVLTMVFDGGPKLGVDPSSDVGFSIASSVFNPPIGGFHPLLAVGVLGVSALFKGVSYLANKPERDRQQAELTAEYVDHSRGRLTEMLRRYNAEANSSTKDDLVLLTGLALDSLPLQSKDQSSVNLQKSPVRPEMPGIARRSGV